MIEQIQKDIKNAMLNKRSNDLKVLRMLKAALDNEKILLRRDLSPADFVSIVRREIKKRSDSAEQFKKGGRDELAKIELDEIIFLTEYLPQQKTPEEIEKIVGDTMQLLGITSKKEMGKIMKAINENFPGQIDGKMLSQIVQRRLN
jgi:uncharacterized protein YqeY